VKIGGVIVHSYVDTRCTRFGRRFLSLCLCAGVRFRVFRAVLKLGTLNRINYFCYNITRYVNTTLYNVKFVIKRTIVGIRTRRDALSIKCWIIHHRTIYFALYTNTIRRFVGIPITSNVIFVILSHYSDCIANTNNQTYYLFVRTFNR